MAQTEITFPLGGVISLTASNRTLLGRIDTRGLEASAENRDRNGARSCQRHRSLESAAPG